MKLNCLHAPVVNEAINLYQNGGNITSAEGVGGGTNMTSTAAPLPSSDASALYNKGRDINLIC